MHIHQSTYLVLWLFLFATSFTQAQATGDSPLGISKLHTVSPSQVHTLIPSQVRLLLSPTAQESFLKELEGDIPDWSLLHDQPNEELGEKLFAFNRQRDEARDGHALLNQQIAFLWSGLLRQYVPAYQGFSVAMGPDVTKTAWGIVRFKPVGLPQEMIAIPPSDFRSSLQQKLAREDKVEIKILFTGYLLPTESIIYAFSHEDPTQGMIMPVVQTVGVQYFFEASE